MKNTTVATIRTVVPYAWTAFIIGVIRRVTGIEPSPEEALVVGGFVLGVVYRAARELEARWPVLGRILLGSRKTPTYIDTTATG